MNYDFQICRLTQAFYDRYPKSVYSEILDKPKRAYNCILLKVYEDFYMCIPYRTEISHAYAYHFTESKRAKEHKSGLDFTKTVIITNRDFVDSNHAVIDIDEYKETMKNIEQIVAQALEYLQDYIAYYHGTKKLSKKKFHTKYRYSTLKYFHEQLHIENS